MNVGFVGAGKVGFSLGKFFAENGIHVTGYYSRHIESALEAAKFTESMVYEELDLLVSDSDVLFLTVPDGEIKSTYDRIKKYNISGKQICHCSGALASSEVFCDIDEYGAYGYSIHPLFPVSNKLTSYRELPGAFFCLEGSGSHLYDWLAFFENHCKGARIIGSSNKVKYHAACAIASNLYLALLQMSVELLQECDFDEKQALDAISPLVISNCKNALSSGILSALTGPVERADIDTIRKHIASFENEEDKRLYKTVSGKLVKIAGNKHPERDYVCVSELLK